MSEQTTTKAEELENLRTAYYLEETLSNLRKESNILSDERPQRPAIPQKPVLQSAQAEVLPYPSIDASKVKRPETWKKGVKITGICYIIFMFSPSLSNIFLGIASMLAVVAGLVYTLHLAREDIRQKRVLQEQYVQRVQQSAEYREECRRIDEENALRQSRLDESLRQKYLRQMEEYEEELQEYKEALNVYKEELLPQWKEQTHALQTAINEMRSSLDAVYSKNIIPAQHRNLPGVLYLATFIGTSQYDLKYAIERYDSYVMQCAQREQINIARAQLAVMRETLANQQYANYLQEQMTDITLHGNDILRSISSWQKADIALREYRRVKAKRNVRKAR